MTPDGARAIRSAAAQLFSRDGYDAVSVASIARKAGVSKANVFHHFATKDELYLAVMRDANQAHADFAENLERAPGDSADKVRQLIAFEIRNQLANRRRSRLVLREIFELGHSRVRRMTRRVFHRNFNAVYRLFEQGRERGEFVAAMDPAVAALLIGSASMLYISCCELLRDHPEARRLESPDAFAAQLAATVLHGICVPKRPARQRPAAPRRPRRDPGALGHSRS